MVGKWRLSWRFYKIHSLIVTIQQWMKVSSNSDSPNSGGFGGGFGGGSSFGSGGGSGGGGFDYLMINR